MKKRVVRAFLLFSGCLWASALVQLGCSEKTPFEYEPQIVVFSLLIADFYHPPIKLERSWGIDEKLPEDGLGVSDADVTVSTLEDTVHYLPVEDDPGVWIAASAMLVIPLKKYHLEVLTAAERVYGETTVPDTFSILQPQGDDTLDPNSTPVLIWSSSRGSTGYLIDIAPSCGGDHFTGVLSASDTVLPMLPLFFDRDPGEHTIKVAALDRSYYDHMTTTDQPGAARKEVTHIRGGLGVFGACVVNSVEVYVR